MASIDIDQEMRIEWAPRYKMLPKSKTYEPFHCKDCNTEVVWAVSKKGNTYMAEKKTWCSDADSSQNGRINERSFYPFHKCEPDAVYQARYKQAMEMLEADRLARIDDGAIVVGQTVVVFKGRKIPVGTAGVVFWISPVADQFDVVKVGFTTDDGEKIFVNIAHLKANK
jgi:hypothetical protein